MKAALIVVALIALAAVFAVWMAIVVKNAIRRRRALVRPKGAEGGTGPQSAEVDISRFLNYVEVYEKRYLAYLVEVAAEGAGADMATLGRLREKYGKEMLAPPYDAQGWLHAKGVSLTDILHMQTEWIRRNGGNLEARPFAREVERIVMTRNVDKAREICRRAGLGPDAEKV